MIGERIEAARTAAGMTRAKLAEACAINTKTLGTYERGSRNPDPDLIAKICEVLHVSADYLLSLTEQPARPAADPDLRPEQLTAAAEITATVYDIAERDKAQPYVRNCLPVIRDIVERLQELQLEAGTIYDDIHEEYPAFELLNYADDKERRRLRAADGYIEGQQHYATELRKAVNDAAVEIADTMIVDLFDQFNNKDGQ